MRGSLAPVANRKRDSTLLLATWNIRDFDSNKFGFGPRLAVSFLYIAQILSTFDLIAVQEVNRDLRPLQRVMRILAREWDYIVTDVTEGTSGNGERMAFIYNTEKVWFRKIAGEVVLPDGQLIVPLKAVDPSAAAEGVAAAAAPPPATSGHQFARSPFLVAFQSGWFKFSLCTVHIYYGAETGDQLKRRIAEIGKLVDFFAARQDAEITAQPDGPTESYVLLGDFNVVSPEHKTIKALKRRGFVVPAPIDGTKVRGDGDHFYDRFAIRTKDERAAIPAGGLTDIWQDVFRSTDEDRALYVSHLPDHDPEGGEHAVTDPAALYEKWRTWQLSDHKPLWVVVDTDYADDYLTSIATEDTAHEK